MYISAVINPSSKLLRIYKEMKYLSSKVFKYLILNKEFPNSLITTYIQYNTIQYNTKQNNTIKCIVYVNVGGHTPGLPSRFPAALPHRVSGGGRWWSLLPRTLETYVSPVPAGRSVCGDQKLRTSQW